MSILRSSLTPVWVELTVVAAHGVTDKDRCSKSFFILFLRCSVFSSSLLLSHPCFWMQFRFEMLVSYL